MEMERKRAPTRHVRTQSADTDTVDPAYIERLRRSMRGAINFARRRQALKSRPVVVDITLDELMEILRRQNYRTTGAQSAACHSGAGALPPMARLFPRLIACRPAKGTHAAMFGSCYLASMGGVAVAPMTTFARAVTKNRPKAIQQRNRHEAARKAWDTRRAAAASTAA